MNQNCNLGSIFSTQPANQQPQQAPVNGQDDFRQQCISAIQNRDNSKGEQLANDILAKIGMTREQAIQQAKMFFNF